MRKKILFLAVLSSLLSCSSELKTDELTNQSSTQVMVNKDKSAGQMHNDLLHLFKQAEQEGKLVVNVTKNEISDDMVLIINDYFYEQGAESTIFSKMLTTIPDVSRNINLLVQSTDDPQLLREQLKAFFIDSLPSTVQLYALTIFDATMLYEGTASYSSEIEKIATTITSDTSLESEYKQQLLYAISIAEYSNTYWHPPHHPLLEGRNLFTYYAGADTAGALAMIQSGAVGAATAVSGWGGLAVLVGGAAFSSFMASR